MSGQKQIKNSKKWRLPHIEKASWLVGAVVGIVLGGMFYLSGYSIAQCIFIGVVWFIGILLADSQQRKIRKLEAELDSFSGEEFLRGMNEFGVEAILGGGNPFGEIAEVKLRFPGGVLHKHLTDAMMSGWEAAQRERHLLINEDQLRGVRQLCESIAARWIEEMTKGLR